MTMRSATLRLLLCCILAAPAGAAVQAPQSTAPPNAMQGFSQNRNQPVRVRSDVLEVRNQKKVATYTGNVHLVQGDTTLRCKTLIVYYDGDQGAAQAPAAKSEAKPDAKSEAKSAAKSAAQPAAATPAGGGNIRYMEAIGQVVVTQNDQTATGDKAVYDMPTNLITLSASAGNYVAVTQGPNVVEGLRLVVHLDTGVSHFEGGVRSRFIPGNNNADDAKPAPEPKPAPPHQAKTDPKAVSGGPAPRPRP